MTMHHVMLCHASGCHGVPHHLMLCVVIQSTCKPVNLLRLASSTLRQLHPCKPERSARRFPDNFSSVSDTNQLLKPADGIAGRLVTPGTS